MDLGMIGDFTVHKKSVNNKILKLKNIVSEGDWVRLPKTGFEIVFANDILPEARASYIPYFKNKKQDHPFYSESIVDLVKKAECGEFNFPKSDIVIGGFPCQDFSLAGKRLGLNSVKSHDGTITDGNIAEKENRGQLYTWMKKVIELTDPKMFIAENVKGMVSLGDVKKIIEEDFRNVGEGYFVQEARVIHSGNYGVPQSRERVFFIGYNKKYLKTDALKKLNSGAIDPYPPKTHNLPNDKESMVGLLPHVSLKDIFIDLVEPEYSEDLSHRSYSKAKYYGKGIQGQSEVKIDGLGPTIRSEHHGNIEFRRLSKENGGKNSDELRKGLPQRRLSVRECARIQTFPDDYSFVREKKEDPEFSLSASGGYRVIGNAVPPLLAYHFAIHIKSIWGVLFD